MQSNTSIADAARRTRIPLTCMLSYVTAIPAPPSDPQHTLVKGGPFASSLVVSFSNLSWPRQSSSCSLDFCVLTLHRWERACPGWVRSNAVMSLSLSFSLSRSLWLDGDETNGKQGKQRAGETVQAVKKKRRKEVVDRQGPKGWMQAEASSSNLRS